MTHAPAPHRAAAPAPRRAVTVYSDEAAAERAVAARRSDTTDARAVPCGTGFTVETTPKPTAGKARPRSAPPARKAATPKPATDPVTAATSPKEA